MESFLTAGTTTMTTSIPENVLYLRTHNHLLFEAMGLGNALTLDDCKCMK